MTSTSSIDDARFWPAAVDRLLTAKLQFCNLRAARNAGKRAGAVYYLPLPIKEKPAAHAK
jgi:hypothetical protein